MFKNKFSVIAFKYCNQIYYIFKNIPCQKKIIFKNESKPFLLQINIIFKNASFLVYIFIYNNILFLKILFFWFIYLQFLFIFKNASFLVCCCQKFSVFKNRIFLVEREKIKMLSGGLNKKRESGFPLPQLVCIRFLFC